MFPRAASLHSDAPNHKHFLVERQDSASPLSWDADARKKHRYPPPPSPIAPLFHQILLFLKSHSPACYMFVFHVLQCLRLKFFWGLIFFYYTAVEGSCSHQSSSSAPRFPLHANRSCFSFWFNSSARFYDPPSRYNFSFFSFVFLGFSEMPWHLQGEFLLLSTYTVPRGSVLTPKTQNATKISAKPKRSHQFWLFVPKCRLNHACILASWLKPHWPTHANM